MQFLHPQLLWALFLLAIPIIIHLFRLRRFQKEPFTNVALLQKVLLQVRKSSQLKKWLIFSLRLLAVAAIVLAFAEPYRTRRQHTTQPAEWVIYLDNSFSMQAKGNVGELLPTAARQLIENLPENASFTLFTNNAVYPHTTINALKKELLMLPYSPYSQTVNQAILKGKTLLQKATGTQQRLVLISDFQQTLADAPLAKDTLTTINCVPVSPSKIANIGIDSLYIAERNPNGFILTATFTQQGYAGITLPVALQNGDRLIAKTAAAFAGNRTTRVSFEVPYQSIPDGSITIEEAEGLPFDNTLYFSLNAQEKIRILSVQETETPFLKRIYSPAEFTFLTSPLNQLNYSLIPNQNLLILNELKTLPVSLINALQAFHRAGGALLIIPPANAALPSYNTLLKNLNAGSLTAEITQERKITTIAYSHPLFKNVFEKQTRNFQYPFVQSYYTYNGSASPILQLENNDPFLIENNRVYLFTASLREDQSDFIKSPLIVPACYNIGKSSLILPSIYYPLGEPNEWEVQTMLPKDNILTLFRNGDSFIPQQQVFDARVRIHTQEQPAEAGVYQLRSGEDTLGYVAFNYNRQESNLRYHSAAYFKNTQTFSSVAQALARLKSENEVTPVWRWFVIFALVLLLLEAILLKRFT